MNLSWNDALREGVVAGVAGGALSAAALAALGHRETGRPLAPINAVSHWLYEPEALHADEASMRHTGVGLVTHHAASVLWATVYAVGRQALRPGSAPSLAGTTATAALAALVDFTITPKRFTPGFEHRLSRGALVGVYAAMAVGMLLGAAANADSPHERRYLP
ncbi:hypothetical protein [Ramlibacter rhizophilus]|uniref:DUF1440 domain-containing protein n=1 Tax=Ramlibacter rhizophilus TaxID=1781167 RepID=A0A4Z0BZ78_9BURK|nr:hypothetical protein [Ramlibacter rhizophilus]TFZ04281.1 hypothetical protein EZ242_00540 [Ramlibacter rhizophilus]